MLAQATEYSIQAASCMSGPKGEYMLVRDIANRTKIPGAYLFKIITRLRKKASETLAEPLPLKTAHQLGYAFTAAARLSQESKGV